MYNDSIRIVRGSKRYVGSLDRDESIPAPLEASQLSIMEGDRNATVNLANQYYIEREFSTTYRLYGGIMPITSNPLTGCTSDPIFMGWELYLVQLTQRHVDTHHSNFSILYPKESYNHF